MANNLRDFTLKYDFYDYQKRKINYEELVNLDVNPSIVFSSDATHRGMNETFTDLSIVLEDLKPKKRKGLILVYEYLNLDVPNSKIFVSDDGIITKSLWQLDLIKLKPAITFVKKQKKG